jgi:maleate cis-trans isomerase
VSPHPLIDTLAYEFYLTAPANVMLVVSCIEIADYTLDAVEAQLSALDRRAEDLVRRGASRIVISGVPIAVALGRERMSDLRQTLSRRWSIPVDTDLEAIIAACHHLGLRRVGLATRWKPDMIAGLTAYLSAAGIHVAAKSSSPRSMAQNAGLDDETGMQLAVALGSEILDRDDPPDGLVLPGGRWITLDAIRHLESAYRRPVVTNYSAGLWAALRDAGDLAAQPGRGLLLETLGGQT